MKIWLLVLVKLVLPPSLALPTGVNYWLGRYLPAIAAAPADLRISRRRLIPGGLWYMTEP